MVTHYLFFAFVAAVGIQRLFELRKNRRNVQSLIARGGREHASGHYIAMVLMHALWFVSMLLEVVVVGREFHWVIFAVALPLTLTGNLFRFLSMRALGERWTTRIVTLPNAKPITGGIYQYFRHPIYVGVSLELAGIPLLHSAYLTALVFTLLNLLLLRVRIREEEKALRSEGGYDEAFGL